jgi:histidinol-phosphatase (PHP family)
VPAFDPARRGSAGGENAGVTLPPDSHVHTQWSWDTATGQMEGSCARAVAIGLPAIAFTEHVDYVAWEAPAGNERLQSLAGADGLVRAPAFDAAGYLAEVERCRELFPELRIMTGLEMGEPHWHTAAFAEVLAAGKFDRVLGSLHCLRDGDGAAEPWAIFPHRPAAEVLREYLAEIPRVVAGSDQFAVLAHIDYPIRSWPAETAGRFDPADFEEEFRHALRATADAGRALEINTRLPMDATLLTWWHEEGGEAVTFGSDAHSPDLVGHGFREAAAMAEAHGFRPGKYLGDFWGRVD